MSAEPSAQAGGALGMVTKGAAVAGAKGGVGATMVTLLVGFGLAAQRRDDPDAVTVLVDTRGDIAIALGQEPGPGISDLASEDLDSVLSELSVDPDPRTTGLLVLLHPGTAGPTLVEIDEAIGQIIGRGWQPVIDCGSHGEAALMVEDLADRFVLSSLLAVTPTTFAAKAAEVFAEPALAVVVDIEDGLLGTQEFADAFGASAVVPRIDALDRWQHEMSVPAELASARDGTGDAQAQAAVEVLTELLYVQHT